MLEQELRLPHTKIRNRLVMGSMHTGLEEWPWNQKRLAKFYEERAKGGVGLIITGGYSTNFAGKLTPFSSSFNSFVDVIKHKAYTQAVHKHGGKIALQLLNAGRYAYHPFNKAPSAIKAPINPYKPKALSLSEIKSTVRSYAKSARLAVKAGYDGVEIMGSEGYLINQFLAPRTNQRTDEYGGSSENRLRFAKEIVAAVRAVVPDDFVIIFRLSMMDLVEGGSTDEEIKAQARALDEAGVDIFNTGIGWHEARVPTIASMVPRGAFADASRKLKTLTDKPVVVVNRINTPELANEILGRGDGDMISMARPLLADPEIFNKYQAGKDDQINVCIACNQGCLDHVFEAKRATCMVNPQAGFELDFPLEVTSKQKHVLVVGAGPAGLACAYYLAKRGHSVKVIDKASELGGQFKIAMRIPGKEDFAHTLTYFKTMLKELNVEISLNTEYDASMRQDVDDVVFATGVRPRMANFPCDDGKKVLAYDEVIYGGAEVGQKVAILGAGGIGFDMVAFLTEPRNQTIEGFKAAWGIGEAQAIKTPRQITMLKRSEGRFGKDLGKTTGWIHRAVAKHHHVKQLAEVSYQKYDKDGLHILVAGEPQVLDVDTVIGCIGQVSNDELFKAHSDDATVHVIGGARLASAIDAKRAIFEALDVARKI